MPLFFPLYHPSHVRSTYMPHVIKGDMDSIRTDVLHFYTNLGTNIVDASHDQNTTDLHKCVAYIRDLTPNTHKSPHLVGDLTMRWEISMFSADSPTHVSSFYLMIALSSFFQRITAMR
ncbi:cAMP-dependent protein kinase subunit, variant 2 [Stylosanthes scabra]|uniref:cAMP-dependent protein kinase subunit, variant 2 n=1 Tax=Stylosanthes scabra TaxID=79078 RepID=A0ABU6U276_9FABA|nr:cAMP-dependent protein kinase subunit, variant 2 [Stylosanthes scabra]